MVRGEATLIPHMTARPWVGSVGITNPGRESIGRAGEERCAVERQRQGKERVRQWDGREDSDEDPQWSGGSGKWSGRHGV